MDDDDEDVGGVDSATMMMMSTPLHRYMYAYGWAQHVFNMLHDHHSDR